MKASGASSVLTRDGKPASIREGRDDEPSGGPQVLVAVREERLDLHYDALVVLLMPVMAELLKPRETEKNKKKKKKDTRFERDEGKRRRESRKGEKASESFHVRIEKV